MMADRNDAFFKELVEHHISGQLKVAPEHMSDNALYYMGKPSFNVYEQFRERYARINQKLGRKQYLVPHSMSSHPGATLDDAIMLAQYLNRIGYMPEQVQDFYPTSGTLSTAMYYTGIDRTMKPVYVAKRRRTRRCSVRCCNGADRTSARSSLQALKRRTVRSDRLWQGMSHSSGQRRRAAHAGQQSSTASAATACPTAADSGNNDHAVILRLITASTVHRTKKRPPLTSGTGALQSGKNPRLGKTEKEK